MLQNGLRSCLCGCGSEFMVQLEGEIPPAYGEQLYYTCPQSKDLLSFSSRGHWIISAKEGNHRVIRVSRLA